jgi:hypothetical protein
MKKSQIIFTLFTFTCFVSNFNYSYSEQTIGEKFDDSIDDASDRTKATYYDTKVKLKDNYKEAKSKTKEVYDDASDRTKATYYDAKVKARDEYQENVKD